MRVVKLVIDGFIAFGTIAVAVLAIWGDWVRSKLAPPALTVTLDLRETRFSMRPVIAGFTTISR